MKYARKLITVLFMVLILSVCMTGTAAMYAKASEQTSQTVENSGWKTQKGKKYYYINGEKATGLQEVSGKQYYFKPSGKNKGQMMTGLQTVGKTKYYFITSGKKKGQMKTGWQTVGGKKYYFIKNGEKKGQMATGWQTIDGKKYYFVKSGSKKGLVTTGPKRIGGKNYYFVTSGSKKGQMVTGWQKISKTTYFFDENGVRDDAKTVNSSRKADKTGSAAEKTLKRAQAIVAQITTEEMSKEQKLRKCFDYVMKQYPGRRPRTPHYYGKDWPVVYANDMFLDGSGNCFSYAAAFAYLAKACGYKEVYCCNDTGHGWCEINGLIYDPEQYRNTTKYKYYGTSYNSVPGYKRGIADWKSSGQGFKRVKI